MQNDVASNYLICFPSKHDNVNDDDDDDDDIFHCFFHLNQFFWFTLSLAGFDPSTRPFLISLAFFMIFFIMFSMVE